MFPVREKSPQCIHRSCPVLPRLDSSRHPFLLPHHTSFYLSSPHLTSSRTLVLHRHSALCLTLSCFGLLPLLLVFLCFSLRNLAASPHLSRPVSLCLASPHLVLTSFTSHRLASPRLSSPHFVPSCLATTRLDSVRFSSPLPVLMFFLTELYAGVTVPRSPLSFLTMEMYR